MYLHSFLVELYGHDNGFNIAVSRIDALVSNASGFGISKSSEPSSSKRSKILGEILELAQITKIISQKRGDAKILPRVTSSLKVSFCRYENIGVVLQTLSTNGYSGAKTSRLSH
jgi:flagellar biosynthesis protein FliR